MTKRAKLSASQQRYRDNLYRGFVGSEAWGKRGSRGLTPRELLTAPEGRLTSKERRYRRVLVESYEYSGSELKEFARRKRVPLRVLQNDMRSIREDSIPRTMPIVLRGGRRVSVDVYGKAERKQVRDYWRSAFAVTSGDDQGIIALSNKFGNPSLTIAGYDVETDVEVLADMRDAGLLDLGDYDDDDNDKMKTPYEFTR